MPPQALSQLASTHAHETLLWASKVARYTFNYNLINGPDPTSQLSSVWHLPAVPTKETSHGRHPTQKPLRLLRRVVLASTARGELVFDPFCGSGTAGVAAEELGRYFVGLRRRRSTSSWQGAASGPWKVGPGWQRFEPSAARTRSTAGGASA